MHSSTRNAASGNRHTKDTHLLVPSSSVVTSRPATFTPIVVEPVERRRLMTSSSYASLTTSAASLSTTVASGSLGFTTSSGVRWPSATGRFMQLQSTTAPPSTVDEDNALPQLRQRPAGSERSELPPPSGRNSEAASTLSAKAATNITLSTTQSVESEVACRKQQTMTVARTASAPDEVAAVTSCTQSMATSGQALSLRDPATAASLTAALAAHLPFSISRSPSIAVPPSSTVPVSMVVSGTHSDHSTSTTNSIAADGGGAQQKQKQCCNRPAQLDSMPAFNVVSQSVLGKRTVTLTSFATPKRVFHSSLFRSLLPQPPNCGTSLGADVSRASRDSTDDHSIPVGNNDDWREPGSVQRQFFVRLTPNNSTATTKTVVSDMSSDECPPVSEEAAKEAVNARDSRVVPMTSALLTNNRQTGNKTTTEVSGASNVQGVMRHEQRQHNAPKSQQWPGASTYNDPKQASTIVVDGSSIPLNVPLSSTAFPADMTALAPTESTLSLSSSAFGPQITVAAVKRGALAVTVDRSQPELPVVSPVTSQACEALRRVSRPLACGATTFAGILPTPSSSSRAVSLLTISGGTSRVGATAPAVIRTPSCFQSVSQPIVTSSTNLPDALPTASASIGLLQHAGNLNSPTIILSAGQSLICVPQQTADATSRNGVQLQSFGVVSSPAAADFRPTTTLVPLTAFSLVQPFNNRHLPSQRHYTNDDVTSRPVSATVQIASGGLPLSKVSTVDHQRQAAIRPHTPLSVGHHPQKRARHEGDSSELQPRHQPQITYASMRNASTMTTVQRHALSSSLSSPSSSATTTPYYLRQCRSRRDRTNRVDNQMTWMRGAAFDSAKSEEIDVGENTCTLSSAAADARLSRRLRIRFTRGRKRRATTRYRKSLPAVGLSRLQSQSFLPPMNAIDFEASYRPTSVDKTKSTADELTYRYQSQAEDEMSDRPPLAMLEALSLRINLNRDRSTVP